MRRKKHIDPIPEEFASYDEAAEFWDTHDTTDYPECFRTVDLESEISEGMKQDMSAILDQIKPETAEMIAAEARAKGLSVDEYLRGLIVMTKEAGEPEPDPGEFIAAMESIAQEGVDPLPPGFSREDIYFPRE
jgi:hypothetical protein